MEAPSTSQETPTTHVTRRAKKWSVSELREKLNLQPHSEGGYYRRTFRDDGVIPHDDLKSRGFQGDRSFGTAIYYLIPKGDRSKFHRLRSNEVWHHYLGDPLVIVEILEDGRVHKTILGKDFDKDQEPQYVVKRNRWFGAYLLDGTTKKGETDVLAESDEYVYCLVGCTVSPGFDPSDWELGDRATMLNEFKDEDTQKEILLLTD